ncbi:MAG: DUF6279 family lipoprotein [Sulfuritalea sp.]|nr:DUF6279 family lipoprotein [Sulfuritalea sp.]MDP1981987.1 DUF6279 family lipoprotein [Sulfuritalea sp.]
MIRRLTLLLVALLLTGCSAVRLGYGNADSLTRWWMDQYLDLSPEQELLTRERLGRFLDWHRKTQLPDYAKLLRESKKLIGGQPSAADALALGDGVIRRGRLLFDRAAPDIADLLMTLTPAQIERMAARFADKNVEYAKKAKLAEDESSQRHARYERLQERAEYWFGDFDDGQQLALRRLIESQESGHQFWYEERLRRQAAWLDLVRLIQREHPPRERTIQLLQDYAAAFDLPAAPARLRKALALRRASADLAIAIHAMATPAQRTHAGHKLDALGQDFTELSQQPG